MSPAFNGFVKHFAKLLSLEYCSAYIEIVEKFLNSSAILQDRTGTNSAAWTSAKTGGAWRLNYDEFHPDTRLRGLPLSTSKQRGRGFKKLLNFADQRY